MHDRSDLAGIRERIRQKRENYIQYDFTRIQNDALKTFFDLAQEFDALRDFYRICVSIPLEFINVESALYLLDAGGDELELVCSSARGYQARSLAPNHVRLAPKPYEHGSSYIVPIYGKRLFADRLPLPDQGKTVIGMLELYPRERLTPSDRFFLIKYSNRIGYNLHNRMVARQNIAHIRFINTLVRDIEHDVIVPNMYYRHLFNQLRKKLNDLGQLEEALRTRSADGSSELTGEAQGSAIDGISSIRESLLDIHDEIQKHYANISLFLESLFRRDHFEQGQLVLRPKKCIVGKEIVTPQLDHYANRFKTRGITIEHSEEMAREEVPLLVDFGLLSQVYANLVSNAIKYTAEVRDHFGRPRKAMAYGQKLVTP